MRPWLLLLALPALARADAPRQGEAAPAEAVAVLSRIDGTVATVHRKAGEYVRKGDLLFALDDLELRLRLAQARGVQAAARGEFERARRTLEIARRAPRAAITPAEFAGLEAGCRIAQAALATAQQDVTEALQRLNAARITAPIDGRIVLLNVRAGDRVSAGNKGTPLAHIARAGGE